jgi:hypothetical protein
LPVPSVFPASADARHRDTHHEGVIFTMLMSPP